MSITAPFQLRKRGVETRLVFGDTASSPALDMVLIKNIARASIWYQSIKKGNSFDQIAEAENLPSARIRQMIQLAFIAPDIIKQIIEGKQPIGFTSEWLQRRDLPSNWQDQRELLKTL